jgi:hypothetical protein
VQRRRRRMGGRSECWLVALVVVDAVWSWAMRAVAFTAGGRRASAGMSI